jgi:hypothetical protein
MVPSQLFLKFDPFYFSGKFVFLDGVLRGYGKTTPLCSCKASGPEQFPLNSNKYRLLCLLDEIKNKAKRTGGEKVIFAIILAGVLRGYGK